MRFCANKCKSWRMINPALISLVGTQRTFNQYSKPQHELGQDKNVMNMDVDTISPLSMSICRNNKNGHLRRKHITGQDTFSPLSMSICRNNKIGHLRRKHTGQDTFWANSTSHHQNLARKQLRMQTSISLIVVDLQQRLIPCCCCGSI